MIQVPLTRGLVALLDDEDAHLAKHRWYALKTKKGDFYAARTHVVDGRKTTTYLHRQVMAVDAGVEVDHKSGDKLDCRRGNLRAASHRQNGRNRPHQANNKSGFKGVIANKTATKSHSWAARIVIDGEQRHLGCFIDAKDAARAYDIAAKQAFGEFARLNFPETT